MHSHVRKTLRRTAVWGLCWLLLIAGEAWAQTVPGHSKTANIRRRERVSRRVMSTARASMSASFGVVDTAALIVNPKPADYIGWRRRVPAGFDMVRQQPILSLRSGAGAGFGEAMRSIHVYDDTTIFSLSPRAHLRGRRSLS